MACRNPREMDCKNQHGHHAGCATWREPRFHYSLAICINWGVYQRRHGAEWACWTWAWTPLCSEWSGRHNHDDGWSRATPAAGIARWCWLFRLAIIFDNFTCWIWLFCRESRTPLRSEWLEHHNHDDGWSWATPAGIARWCWLFRLAIICDNFTCWIWLFCRGSHTHSLDTREFRWPASRITPQHGQVC